MLVKDFRTNKKHHWPAGRLLSAIGSKMWNVAVDGNVWRRHANQILNREWLTEKENFEARRLAAAQELEKVRSFVAAPSANNDEGKTMPKKVNPVSPSKVPLPKPQKVVTELEVTVPIVPLVP